MSPAPRGTGEGVTRYEVMGSDWLSGLPGFPKPAAGTRRPSPAMSQGLEKC